MTAERTMFQETVRAIFRRAGFLPPLVVCNDEHRFIIAAQLQALGISPTAIVLEPVGRNTAAAAAIAALILSRRGAGYVDAACAIRPRHRRCGGIP